MSHPSVVTLGAKRAARRLVCGEELRAINLPVGTRVVYPRAALPSVPKPEQAILHALDAALGSEPLSARLDKTTRLAIALEALYHGPDASYDYVGRALGVVVKLARDKGIEHIDVLLATGIHRRLLPAERKLLLGHIETRGITLHEHDPEGEEALVPLDVGPEAPSSALALNRIARNSDLLVTIAVTGWPFGGGHAALVLGLGGYANEKAVRTLALDDRHLATRQLGVLFEQKVSTFAIELVLDSTLLHHELRTLNCNEDDLSAFEQLGLRSVNHLPRRARLELIEQVQKHPGLIGVYCGDTSEVAQAARAKYVEQHAVPFTTQADVLVTGLPLNTPFNAVGGSVVGAVLNPILLKHTLEALVLRRNTGVSILKPGGTVVLLHPCSNRFDHAQHTAFFDFFNTVVTEGSAPSPGHGEIDFLQNPALLALFRTGHAYHPTLPFLLWEQARGNSAARVIVVGADNESVPRCLGYETASSVPEALFRARGGGPQPQDVVCLHNPLAVLCHQVEH